MRKTARIAAVSLAIAIVFTLIGGIMVSRAKVNTGDIYDIFKDSIKLDETNVTYTRAQAEDMSDMEYVTVSDTASYQLNEFNSVNIFADYCGINLVGTTEDSMSISLAYTKNDEKKVFLKTAVRDGTLYIQNEWGSAPAKDYSNAVITVGIPENYKGGYSINGSHCCAKLDSIESSMDTSVNLYDSTVEAKTISAGEITVELSGTSGSIEKLLSSDGINISAVSSDIKMNTAESIYTKITANSTTLDMDKISGSVTAALTMCTFDAAWARVGGNISVAASYGRINLTVPENSPVALRHEESFSVFNDNVNWTDTDSKNKDSRYFIDTNVKFGIVTLSEK